MQNFQRKWYYIGLIMIPVIGHVLNMLCSHRNFYFNLYMLFAMLIIQLVVLKRIDAENLAIRRELLQAEENSIRGSFSAKTSMLLNVKGRLISIALVFIYIAAMFEIGCIELTITGIFGGILGAVVFYVGIQLYFRYLALLYFSWDLKNLQIKRYMFSFPALTDWIARLANEFRYIEKWFLVLGIMYCGVYAANVPVDAITIGKSFSLHSSSNLLFLVTWIGILIFFVLAAPVFMFLSRYFVKASVGECKSRSIEIIEKQPTVSADTSEEDLNKLQAKVALIREVALSADFPPKYCLRRK